MLGKITQVKRNLVKALLVSKTCSYQDLPKAIEEGFAQLMPYITSQGVLSAGAPFVAYKNSDMSALKIEVGMPVGQYVEDAHDIYMGEIPEGDYIRAVYTGPYSELKEGYKAMSDYMQAQGLEAGDTVYESYLNNPSDTVEAKLKTEILFVIKA